MHTRHPWIVVIILLVVPCLSAADTTITYQGQLEDASGPVTGTPGMEFRLFDSPTDGAQIGTEIILSAVPVTDGLFQVELDFGAAYGAGPRYLQVMVSGNTLAPRQRIGSTPLATHALNVETGAVGSAQIVDGDVGASDIDSSQVQRRVSGSCASGMKIAGINADGSVTCEPDDDSGGDITGVIAGTGLTGGATGGEATLGIADGAVGSAQTNDSQIQRRVSGSCTAGESIRTISADGSVACELDNDSGGDITGVIAGTGLTGGATGGEATLGVADGAFWSTSGHAADGSDFIGTTNSTPLELRVNNRPVTRIFDRADADGNHAPNLIAGSELNVLDESGGSVIGATIAGGGGNPDDPRCGPDGSSQCINTVSADLATVVGGYGNYATGFTATAMGSGTTASGSESTAVGQLTIASGSTATAMGSFTTASGFGATAMGRHTTASGHIATAMGRRTLASGHSSTAMGSGTTAGGDYSLAAGRRAIVRDAAQSGETDFEGNCTANAGECGDEGTFVWADSQFADFTSTGPDQFLVRARGGAEFEMGSNGLKAFSSSASTTGAAIQAESRHSSGIALSGRNDSDDTTLVLNNRGTGPLIKAFRVGTLLLQLSNNGNLFIAGALSENSDRNAKEAIESIDNKHILQQLTRLDITSWRYKDNPEHVRHIGPMAQDFHALFGLGESETSLAGTDVRGVALAAIQALHDENRRLESRLGGLETELEAQSREVADLKSENARLLDMAQSNRELEQRLATLESLLLDQRLAQKEGP